jgi:hypothetical protein
MARAIVPLSPGEPIQGYSNPAATQQRQQQQQAQNQAERQANLQRLRAFFKTHQAQAWTTLRDIAQNPFRYAGRVVVTVAKVDEVINPTRATLYGQTDDGWWIDGNAVLDGDGLAQWKTGPRLLAVRVMGRIKKKDDPYEGLAQLQLVGSQACTERRCMDWLRLPAPLKDGQTP